MEVIRQNQDIRNMHSQKWECENAEMSWSMVSKPEPLEAQRVLLFRQYICAPS